MKGKCSNCGKTWEYIENEKVAWTCKTCLSEMFKEKESNG